MDNLLRSTNCQKEIYNDNELKEESTIRKFRIVQKEGNRKVSRDVVQFRKWVNEIVKEYTIKGFAMDDERLKNNEGNIIVDAIYKDETLWLLQKGMSKVFDVGVPTILKHLKKYKKNRR